MHVQQPVRAVDTHQTRAFEPARASELDTKEFDKFER